MEVSNMNFCVMINERKLGWIKLTISFNDINMRPLQIEKLAFCERSSLWKIFTVIRETAKKLVIL